MNHAPNLSSPKSKNSAQIDLSQSQNHSHINNVNNQQQNNINDIEFFGIKSPAPLFQKSERKHTPTNLESLFRAIKGNIARLAIHTTERDSALFQKFSNSGLKARSETEFESNLNESTQKNDFLEAIKKINDQEMEQNQEALIHPRAEIICDRDHIENQRIDVINRKDLNKTEFRFKLRTPTKEISTLNSELDGARKNDIEEITTKNGAILRRGKITYNGKSTADGYGVVSTLCDATVYEKNGIKVFIADPTSRDNYADDISVTENRSKLIRTALGLIKAEAPSDMSPELAKSRLREILEKDLGIPSALSKVSKEAEQNYKTARYKWQHAIEEDLTSEQIAKAKALEYEEVFPGYTTLVEKGIHKEYFKEGNEDIRATHLLYEDNFKSVYNILTHGLMSTTERFSRGIMRNGMSSNVDIDTGGADNVFTRITNSKHRKQIHGNLIIFKPELFDRTDWYAYGYDNYGSTYEENFSDRLSPKEAIAQISDDEDILCNNEQMFRTGIGANYIESIMVDPINRNKYIKWLKEKGIEEFDGRNIEEVIISRESFVSDSEDADELDDHDDFDKDINTAKHAYEDSIKKQMKEAQNGIQSLINGEKPYTSIDEIADLASNTDDFNKAFENMITALIEQGKKEQLSSDIKEYIKDEMTMNELAAVANDKWPDGYLESDKQSILFLKNELGVDYKAIYEESLI